MKRTHLSCMVVLACGWLAASAPVFAQDAPTPSPNWLTGNVSVLLLGRDNISSSKFDEYREVPKGVSMPGFSFQGSQDGKSFALFAENVSRSDQRYFGSASLGWLGVRFDYNQIPHNMGNGGRVIHTEVAPGVWAMSGTLRKELGDAVDAVPAAQRTYAFYSNLLEPTLASAGRVDVSGLRQRGDVAFDLPYGVTLTYMREAKTGYRGASGGDILGVVTSAVDVPEPMNELTQDFGIKWARKFAHGNAYASFNRNIYNDRQGSLIIDNPFRATDLPYTSTAVPGGPAQVRFSMSPDNEASRGAFGGQIKLARHTRLAGDVAIGRWTQDDAFLPFTINSAIRTPSGALASDPSLLPRRSLDGQINTTSVNLSLVSRPVDPLSVRLRFRSYDLVNKTTPISWLGGSASGSPDRSWSTPSASADAPYGYATANLYDYNSKRFDAQVGYDIANLTFEAAYRHSELERTSREATAGDEDGYSLSAVLRGWEWLAFRGVVERIDRTAKNWNPASSIGLQADEAERERTRAGVDVEITPLPTLGVVLSYFRWNDDYPNRPMRVAGNPDTTVGLLEAGYDTFTVELDYRPNERAEVSAYYTYEKNTQTNRWVTLSSGNLNNQLRYEGRDEGDTYGLNALLHLVPEKWTFSLQARHQKVDGFMDITAREAGAFYNPGRTTLVPPGTGGAQDIADFDDTELTTVLANLAYSLSSDWTFNVGYAYDKYTFSDAFTAGTSLLPQSVLFFMRADDRSYTANLVYTQLSYRF